MWVVGSQCVVKKREGTLSRARQNQAWGARQKKKKGEKAALSPQCVNTAQTVGGLPTQISPFSCLTQGSPIQIYFSSLIPRKDVVKRTLSFLKRPA